MGIAHNLRGPGNKARARSARINKASTNKGEMDKAEELSNNGRIHMMHATQKIKALIDPLLAKDNRIPVKAICQASGVQLYDMPGLQKYRDSTGRSTICWNNVLKGCGWTKCPLRKVGGHVPREEIMDGFANSICDKLGKGVLYLMTNHQSKYKGPSPKKPKTTMAATTDVTGDTQE